MTAIQERYVPYPMAVNAAKVVGSSVAGFVAKTAGNISITDANGVVLVDAIPVLAGVYLPLPFVLPGPNTTVQLSNGASGTLAA